MDFRHNGRPTHNAIRVFIIFHQLETIYECDAFGKLFIYKKIIAMWQNYRKHISHSNSHGISFLSSYPPIALYPSCSPYLITTRWNRYALHWRHNERDGVSNYRCLLNRLIRRRSKKTSKLRVTGLCVGNSPGLVNSPHKGPVTRKMFPFDDVIMNSLFYHNGHHGPVSI